MDSNQLSLFQLIEKRSTKSTLLSSIAIQAMECKRCKYHRKRNQVVFGRGDPDADIMVIGMAPGRHEDSQGQPFVGASGHDITKILSALGLDRHQVYLCNALKCRPLNEENKDDEIIHFSSIRTCNLYLVSQIETIQPQVIIAVGGVALKALFGNTAPTITHQRGKWMEYKGIPVMPTFHPAYFYRQMPDQVKVAKKRQCWEDWKRAIDIVRTTPKSNNFDGEF